MARSLAFYAAVVAVAAILILVSLGPGLFRQQTPQPQAGLVEDGALVFGPAALFQVENREPVDVIARARADGQPVGLRLTAKIGAGEPNPADRGVRLLLAPSAAAFLGPRAAVVDLALASLGPNNAERLAVSLQDVGPVEWRIVEVPATLPATISVELPASALGLAPDAIGVRAVSARTDFESGVQITAIRVRPVGDPVAPPPPP